MNEKIFNTIAKHIAEDMNENGMKISEDTMAAIGLVQVTGASQSSLEAVRDWFNSKNIAAMPEKDQKRYVGATVNLLALIASNDVEGIVKNWVLSDM